MSSELSCSAVAGTDPYAYLTSFSDQDKPWDTHRRNAEAVEALYRQTGFDKYADRMHQCSQWLLFVLRTVEDEVLRLKLYSSFFCRVRHCPSCQWRKSLMWRGRFLRAVPRLLADNPGIRFIFLTLTVRNCHVTELRSQLAQMNHAWSLLTRRSNFRQVLGWVKSVEVTRGADRDKRGRVTRWREDAHPHFHCLLAVSSTYFVRGNYIKQDKWRELWQSCLGVDYLPVVHIRAVRPKPQIDDPNNPYLGLIIALCETLKYTVKEEELVSDSWWLSQLTTQLHKTRSVAVGGILKQYFSEDEPEDLIHTDEDDQVDISLNDCGTLVFDWSSVIKRYVLRDG